MNMKTFWVLLILVGVLGLTSYFLLQEERPGKDSEMMGKQIFSNLPANDIAAVEIAGVEDDQLHQVRLARGEKVWEVLDRFNYPADFSALADLIRKIREAKAGRNFEADDGTLSRLGLYPPDAEGKASDERGIQILLKAENGAGIATIIIGKARTGEAADGGQYLMEAGTKHVYLVDQSFRMIDKTPAGWIDKQILDVKSGDIRQVVCRSPESKTPEYILQRSEKGDSPELVNPPESRKLKKSKADSLFEALSSLKAEDVAGRLETVETPGFETHPSFEFHTFDGISYRVYPGNPLPGQTDKYYMRIQVDFAASQTGDEKIPDQESDEDKKKREAQQESVKKAQELHGTLSEKLSPWVFVISDWQHKLFVARVEDLFEEEPKNE